MAKRGKVGTSAFTHIDDATAPIHSGDPNHFDALHYGDNVPPKHELQEIVLGPSAFGSPDPRTLGHVMNPAIDRPASAPALDDHFEDLVGRGAGVVVVTEEQLNEMTKAELLDLGKRAGLTVKTNMSKDDLINTILESEGSSGGSLSVSEEDEETVEDDEDENS